MSAVMTYAFGWLDGAPVPLAGAVALNLVPATVEAPPATLRELIAVSLFTDARSRTGDALPDAGLPDPDRGGWWGDTYAADAIGGVEQDRIGSRLWLLRRATLTAEAVERARRATEEALRWLVDDGVAERVDVRAERAERARGRPYLAVEARVTRGIATRFPELWDAEAKEAAGV